MIGVVRKHSEALLRVTELSVQSKAAQRQQLLAGSKLERTASLKSRKPWSKFIAFSLGLCTGLVCRKLPTTPVHGTLITALKYTPLIVKLASVDYDSRRAKTDPDHA